jgi:hypothetical protein
VFAFASPFGAFVSEARRLSLVAFLSDLRSLALERRELSSTPSFVSGQRSCAGVGGIRTHWS